MSRRIVRQFSTISIEKKHAADRQRALSLIVLYVVISSDGDADRVEIVTDYDSSPVCLMLLPLLEVGLRQPLEETAIGLHNLEVVGVLVGGQNMDEEVTEVGKAMLHDVLA